jgi:hypothetical protein
VSADAIFNVTVALKARLDAALTAAKFPGEVFIGPLDDADSSGAPLILFLYRIVPNANLRNGDHRVASGGPPPPVLVFHNSLPLDLYFLLTVGTMPGSSEEKLLEALGIAMQEMQLDPELHVPAVSHETVHVSLEPLTTDESSRIWTLFPNANYRTSIAYLATPVWIDPPRPEAEGPRVRRDRLDAGTIIPEVGP